MTDEDEPAVKKWLTKRWKHLQKVWQGIA